MFDPEGRPALVMQFYEGQTLAEILTSRRQERTPLPLDDAMTILRDIAAGIAALHRSGITHRDIKPANIIVARSGAVLADFGVVRSNQLANETTATDFVGTIRYAAPEYLFGGPYNQRIDVDSFGAIAYEVIVNAEVLGEHQLWARVVLAKQTGVALSEEVLVSLAARIGFNAAEFCRYAIEHSFCESAGRDLDLQSFAAAVEQRLWTTSFVATDGVFRPDDKRFDNAYVTGSFKDRYSTATAAATAFNKLAPDVRRDFRSFIAENYWKRFSYSPAPRGYVSWQLPTEVIGYTYTVTGEFVFVFYPSIKEALALGLLE